VRTGYTRTMPAVGVCLLSGIVQGIACSWTPPTNILAPSDTTAFGKIVDLPATLMWPGETRRIPLPTLNARPGSRHQYELRGHGLMFGLNESRPLNQAIVRGAFLSAAPAATVGIVVAAASSSNEAPSFCVVRVDSLAQPGDTLRALYTISTTTNPPRRVTWRLRIIVDAPIITMSAGAASVRTVRGFTVHPNPCNPEVGVSFELTEPGKVTVEVFNARGCLVTRMERREAGVGEDTIIWDGTDSRGQPAASGVYVVRMRVGTVVQTRKVTLLN
jgi:hypothetical protein